MAERVSTIKKLGLTLIIIMHLMHTARHPSSYNIYTKIWNIGVWAMLCSSLFLANTASLLSQVTMHVTCVPGHPPFGTAPCILLLRAWTQHSRHGSVAMHTTGHEMWWVWRQKLGAGVHGLLTPLRVTSRGWMYCYQWQQFHRIFSGHMVYSKGLYSLKMLSDRD